MMPNAGFGEHVLMINKGMLKDNVDSIALIHIQSDGLVATSLSYDLGRDSTNVYALIGALEALKQQALELVERSADEDE